MMVVFMLSERMWPRVRRRVIRMDIAPRDHGACGGVIVYRNTIDHEIWW
jgi:hypothetical protein